MTRFHTVSLFVLGSLLFCPHAAHAKLHEGYYVGGMAVMPFERDGDSNVSGLTNSEVEYMTGWGMSADGGYSWGNGLRTEVEFVYRNNKINKVEPSALSDGGGIHNMALMANAFYDFDLEKRLTPYVGFGVGGARVDADNMRHMATNTAVDDTVFAFAYQFIAGFNFDLEGPWSFTADYRYFATPDLDFDTNSGVKAETENSSHNIMMGLRYDFAPAAPAPEPVPEPVAEPALALAPVPQLMKLPTMPAPQIPAPVPPVAMPVLQSYIVFFDFDKSALTPAAKRILASAADDYKGGKYIKVVVKAHTDTSGSRAYNEALSQRRARSVRQELERLNVPSQVIVTNTYGERMLMVPTTDGVREAQNRRAEILLEQ